MAGLCLYFWAEHRQVGAQRHMGVREGPERYQDPRGLGISSTSAANPSHTEGIQCPPKQQVLNKR